MEANRFYGGSGLSLKGDSAEVPDHMAVELEFMSFLLQKAIQAEAEGDMDGYTAWVEKRRVFLDRFLSRWYGDFCDAIRKGTDNRFCLALADCLEGVVKKDMEALSLFAGKNKGQGEPWISAAHLQVWRKRIHRSASTPRGAPGCAMPGAVANGAPQSVRGRPSG